MPHAGISRKHGLHYELTHSRRRRKTLACFGNDCTRYAERCQQPAARLHRHGENLLTFGDMPIELLHQLLVGILGATASPWLWQARKVTHRLLRQSREGLAHCLHVLRSEVNGFGSDFRQRVLGRLLHWIIICSLLVHRACSQLPVPTLLTPHTPKPQVVLANVTTILHMATCQYQPQIPTPATSVPSA